jgi:hypothetical protein
VAVIVSLDHDRRVLIIAADGIDVGHGDARSDVYSLGLTLTHTGDIVGTLRYMAPERFNGHGDARSDVYSLGLTLYELLTLRLAFTALDRTQLIHKVMHDEPARPRALNPKVPRDLETIVLKAMERDPARRYPTAQELAEDLQRFLEGRPIQARPVGTLEQLAKWARRRPDIAVLVGGIVLVLIGGTAVSSYFALEAHQREKRAQDNAVKAHNKEKEARENEQKANESRALVEATLARSLLPPMRGAPIGKPFYLKDSDLEAIWELAESTDDRVRLRFIEQAISQPGTLRELDLRKDMILHAAVGLDRIRNQRVAKLLLTRLRDEHMDGRGLAECVGIGIALGDPEFTQVAGRVLTDALAKETNPTARLYLALGLAAVATRLGPQETAAAARVLTDALAKETDSSTRSSLARGLAAVAAQLGPEEAAAAARVLTDAFAKETNPPVRRFLAQGLAAVAARLEPEEAARYAAAAARVLTDALAKETDWNARSALAQGLAAVANWLRPQEAAVAARVLTDALAKETNPSTQPSLSQGWAAVAARLEPEEAAVAARVWIDALAKETSTSVRLFLAQGLAAVVAQLEPQEAAQYAAAAARILTDALTKETNRSARSYLAQGLAAVTARRGLVEAAAAVRILTDALAKETDWVARSALARGLAAVAAPLGPEEAARQSVAAARGIGEMLSPSTRLSGLATLTEASQPVPSLVTTQQLVELLKMPTCIGEARTVVLEMLGQRYQRTFADQWEFVDFAERHLPDIDLKSPPKRPQK